MAMGDLEHKIAIEISVTGGVGDLSDVRTQNGIRTNISLWKEDDKVGGGLSLIILVTEPCGSDGPCLCAYM